MLPVPPHILSILFKINLFTRRISIRNPFYKLLFQVTVADEKRIVEEQRRALDEEIADFQRRKVTNTGL